MQLEAADLAGYRHGRAARVLVDGADVGAVGEVSSDVVAALDLMAPVVAFEVELDGLALATQRDQTYAAPSRFPASMIDLAFVVDATVPAAAIERTLRAAVGDLLEDVRCFDEFTADSLGEGKRSLAFSLRFRAPDRTLADSDVTDARQRAIDEVIAAHDATLR